MPDLKYLYRVLYILINCFLCKLFIFIFNKTYYQESYILIIEYSSVVTSTELLDGSIECQKALQWFDTRKSQHMFVTFLSLKQ